MRTAALTILFLVVVTTAHSQQRTSPVTADTTRSSGIFILDAGLSTGRASLLLPPALQYDDFADDTPLFTLWKKTAIPPPLLGGLSEPKADLTAPLRAGWAKEAQFKTLRTVLGTVQIGAVGYLAYRALTSKETPKPIKKK